MEDHGNVATAYFLHFAVAKGEQVALVEPDFAIGNFAGRILDKLHNRKRVYAFSASAFTDNAENFTDFH